MGSNRFRARVRRQSDVVDAPDPSEPIEVRHVQPYQAVRSYRCPGCDHEIAVGSGHEVVVPISDPGRRRHWHTGCWRAHTRRQPRPA